MRRHEFIEILRGDSQLGLAGFRGYTGQDETRYLLVSGVTTADRDRIMAHARTFGLNAQIVNGAELFGERPSVRCVITGWHHD